MLTERITMQQKTHGGRITAFLLRSIHPLCEEHTDMYSLLSIAATASQWKKVYVGTVKVCTELWRQFQALFLFHPCQLVAASSKLAFSCPCSFSCLFLHMPKLCFQFRSAKGRLYLKKFFCDWTQGKAGESPKTNKNPCHPFVELAQRPESELP